MPPRRIRSRSSASPARRARARLYKEDFQAIDIEAIAKPVAKWAVTVREPALVPRVFQQAFHLMRSGRPGTGAHRPADRRADGRDRIRHRHLSSAARLQARGDGRAGAARRRDAERVRASADRRRRRRHQRRRERSSGRVRRTDRRAGDPDAHGLGLDPGRPSADGGHGRPADQPSLRQRHVPRVRLRVRDRQSLGEPTHRLDRRLHAGPEIRPRRHRADADRPRVRAGLRHRLRCARRARAFHPGRARVEERGRAEGSLRLGGRVPAPQEEHASARAISTRCR